LQPDLPKNCGQPLHLEPSRNNSENRPGLAARWLGGNEQLRQPTNLKPIQLKHIRSLLFSNAQHSPETRFLKSNQTQRRHEPLRSSELEQVKNSAA
jgi:hypothetical protein